VSTVRFVGFGPRKAMIPDSDSVSQSRRLLRSMYFSIRAVATAFSWNATQVNRASRGHQPGGDFGAAGANRPV